MTNEEVERMHRHFILNSIMPSGVPSGNILNAHSPSFLNRIEEKNGLEARKRLEENYKKFLEKLTN
jgi:hypothetical protein